MKWIINFFKNLFKTKPTKTPPPQVVVLTTPSLRILFLPGHKHKGGAPTYRDGFNEADWNRRIVRGIRDNYRGHHKLIIDEAVWRTESSSKYMDYCRRIGKYVEENGIDLVIEQHINSADGKAYGTENIIRKGHDDSFKYATVFSKEFHKRFKIKLRREYMGVKGIKAVQKGDRGFYFVEYVTKNGAAAFLQEPFFANWASSDSRQFLDDIDVGIAKMVDFYIAGLNQI